MRFDTPLRKRHRDWCEAAAEAAAAVPAAARPGAAVGGRAAPIELDYLPWGDRDEAGEAQCEVPAAYGEIQLEYAALHAGAGLIDEPQRGVLRICGADRRDFLNRMLTAPLADLGAGACRPGFWLNRKGRIEAELVVVELGEETWLDLDVHRAEPTRASLDAFVIAEDVTIVDRTADAHRLGLHGRFAPALLDAAVGGGLPPLDEGRAARIVLGGAETIVFRRDLLGRPGLELIVPRDAAAAAWDAILAAECAADGRARRARPVGWYAFNVARLEAGRPLFGIDYGTQHLPHETGVLREHVSFTKGCYLGQEVVARMESLGRPKQVLVGLAPEGDALPITGAQVFARDAEGGVGEPVGAVTSSTPSPRRGLRPHCLAMVRSAQAEPGTMLLVAAEGELVPAQVGPLAVPAPAEGGA